MLWFGGILGIKQSFYDTKGQASIFCWDDENCTDNKTQMKTEMYYFLWDLYQYIREWREGWLVGGAGVFVFWWGWPTVRRNNPSYVWLTTSSQNWYLEFSKNKDFIKLQLGCLANDGKWKELDWIFCDDQNSKSKRAQQRYHSHPQTWHALKTTSIHHFSGSLEEVIWLDRLLLSSPLLSPQTKYKLGISSTDLLTPVSIKSFQSEIFIIF